MGKQGLVRKLGSKEARKKERKAAMKGVGRNTEGRQMEEGEDRHTCTMNKPKHMKKGHIYQFI